MSEHDAVRSLLADFVTGSLPAEEGERVRRHLDVCAYCSRNTAVLQRLVMAVQRLPAPVPAAECLVRVATLARDRRIQVIEGRQQTYLTAAVALLGWAMVIISLPLWQGLAEKVRIWSGWPVAAGFPIDLAIGALLSYLFLPALWVLLEGRRVIEYEEGRR